MNNSGQKPITGRQVFVAFAAFFGVIITVNMTMAVLASQSFTGLEVKNSYVASQDYNKTLAQAAKQRELGWTSKLSHDGNELRLSLVNSAGSEIQGAQISALAKRIVQQSDDYPVVFTEAAPGQYRADAPVLAGPWDIDVIARVPGQTQYRQIFRVQVKG